MFEDINPGVVVGAGTSGVRDTVQAGKYPTGHTLPGEYTGRVVPWPSSPLRNVPILPGKHDSGAKKLRPVVIVTTQRDPGRSTKKSELTPEKISGTSQPPGGVKVVVRAPRLTLGVLGSLDDEDIGRPRNSRIQVNSR
jgi:hypothetical protein